LAESAQAAQFGLRHGHHETAEEDVPALKIKIARQ
jgi:hypothetical protein